MIESVHGEPDVLTSDAIEDHFLREELPDEAVHIFVGTTHDVFCNNGDAALDGR